MALTRDDLLDRTDEAIERDEAFIYNVAAEHCQIVGNVRGMRWFVGAVANWLIDNTGRWSHLEPF